MVQPTVKFLELLPFSILKKSIVLRLLLKIKFLKYSLSEKERNFLLQLLLVGFWGIDVVTDAFVGNVVVGNSVSVELPCSSSSARGQQTLRDVSLPHVEFVKSGVFPLPQ